MVARLEDLCGIQFALEFANEPNFKKRFYPPVLNYNFISDSLKEGCPPISGEASDALQEYPIVFRNCKYVALIELCVTQMIKWAHFHKEKFDMLYEDGCKFLRSSFFTPKGLVDKEIAARELVKEVERSVSFRFCIACYYCFSDIIPVLWKQLSEHEKPRMDNGEFKHGLGIAGDNKMVSLWSRYLLLNECKGKKFLQSKFKIAIQEENEVAAQICWKEFDEEEKNKISNFSAIFRINNFTYSFSLYRFSRNFHRFHTLLPFQSQLELIIFAIPHYNKYQLKSLFKPRKLLYFVLFYLLSLPYQHLFMDMVDRTLEILSERGFYLLLLRITNLIHETPSCKIYDYHKVFRDFWNKFPSFKRFVFLFDCSDNRTNVINFLDFEDGKYSEEFYFGKEFLLQKLFFSPFTNGYTDIINLVLEDATSEEKLVIVESHLKKLWLETLSKKDFKLIVFFIEILVPEKKVLEFKSNFVNGPDGCRGLWEFILHGNLNEVQKFINWALIDEEINDFNKILLTYLNKDLSFFDIDKLRCIDDALKWILSSNDIQDYKKPLMLSVDDIALNDLYSSSLLVGNFETLDFYLRWILSSQKEIQDYKKELAFKAVCNMNSFDVCKDLERVKAFIQWCELSEIDVKLFKKWFAFNKGGMLDCCGFLVNQKFDRIDEFIRWSELSEIEIRRFKKRLIYHKETFTKFIDWSVCDISRFVDLLKWIQFSGADLKIFYSKVIKKINLRRCFTKVFTDVYRVDDFLKELPLSKVEVKNIKKKFGLKSSKIIKDRVSIYGWEEAETLLNWCFSSKKEISQFKRKFPLDIKICVQTCLEFILKNMLFRVEKFLTWTEMSNKSKVNLVEIIGKEGRFFRKILNCLLENDYICSIEFSGVSHSKQSILYEKIVRKLLNWLFKNKTSMFKWRASFLKWCHKSGNKRQCFKCCRSDRIPHQAKVLGKLCLWCDRRNLTRKEIEELRNKINKHFNRMGVCQKLKN